VDFGSESEMVGVPRGAGPSQPDKAMPSPIKKRHPSSEQDEDDNNTDAIDFLNQINAPKDPKDKVVKPIVVQPSVGGVGNRGIDRFLPKPMDYSPPAEVLPPRRNILLTPSAKNAQPGALVPMPGGGYEFKGKTFVARISNRGEFSFERNSLLSIAGNSFNPGIPTTNAEERYKAERDDFLKRQDVRDAIYKITDQANKKLAPIVEIDLEEMWNNPGLTLQNKKDKIFQYWESLAISLTPIIFRFINRHLPQGSANEYTKDELSTYKKEGFFPYGKEKQ